MTTSQQQGVLTEEQERVLADAFDAARDNLLFPSTSERFAFVRNYCDILEALSDEQLSDFLTNHCPLCFGPFDVLGNCDNRCQA